MSISYIDIFCGAGGSSLGLTAAGMELKLAANHWDRAIETHSANFPHAEHLCTDINYYDMRNLPAADVGWFSPICTELSPSNGQRKTLITRGQMLLEEATGDHVPKPAFERTRATCYDVIRATEVWRYKAVIVENVPNLALKWDLFDWWLAGMRHLGYNHQLVSVSSAHIWGPTNLPAPQWRDRLYIVFTRKGIPLPDVAPRPLARCFDCDQDVHAVQSWKRPDRVKVGAYGRQYVYRCPNSSCRNAVVEPYVLPAASAIDWSDLGVRIGDRETLGMRPLAPATLRRIEVGWKMFAQPVVVANAGNTWERPGSEYVRAWPALESALNARTATAGDGVATPVMVNVNHGEADGLRAYQADTRPLATRTVKIGEGMVIPPFIAELRGGGSTARSVTHPLATVTAGGNHHGLTVPPGAFTMKHHGGLDYARPEHMVKDVAEPFGTIVSKSNMSLVIPFRRGAVPHPAQDRPISTVATREQHGVMRPAGDVQDCRFRMLKPREHLAAQRFPGSYDVKGNSGEQTKQAGNAVSANVAQWLGERLMAVLD